MTWIDLLSRFPGAKQALHKYRRLQERIATLEARQAELEKRLLPLPGMVKTLSDYHRRVDLVDFGILAVFMYMDDLAYQNTRAEIRHFSVEAQVERLRSAPPLQPPSLHPLTHENYLFNIFAHHWEQNLPFVFIDVGCQYGSFALYTAQVIRSFGRSNRVIAFDIGVAGSLVPYNIEINGLGDLVTFEPMAVTGHSLPSLVFTEFGRSENNRVTNRYDPSEFESYVARSTTLDDYIARHNIHENLIIKIDAQGAEYDIWQGMRGCLAERNVTAIMEFAPHALASRIKPLDFLAEMNRCAWLFDLPAAPPGLALVNQHSLAAFVDEVNERPGMQTDLLLLPRKLPGVDKLLKEMIKP